MPPLQALPTATRAFNQLYLWGISLAAALGGLLFGYDWVVIGGAKPFYEPYFQIHSPARQGWAMSCALVGCLLGSIASGYLSDRFGRKRMLIVAGFAFALSSLGTGLAYSFLQFVLWRIAGGFGDRPGIRPLPYVHCRGCSGRVTGQVSRDQSICDRHRHCDGTGDELADRSGRFRPAQHGSRYASRGMASLAGDGCLALPRYPQASLYLAMFVVPESPRWLAKKGLRARSESILARIGGDAYSARVFAEVEESLTHRASESPLRELLNRRYARPLLLGIGLAVLQQWCGINVIFNYAQEIFTAAGYNLSSMLFNIMVTGFVNLIFTVLAVFTVDRLGRRALMLAGSGGLAILYVCLGSAYYFHLRGFAVLLLVAAAIACYAMTLAPVTWVLLSEIFPNRIRSAGMSVATTSLWSACFVLTYTFPVLNQRLGAARIFWLYTVICLAGFAMVFKWVPETKGRTLEAIEGFWK